jgi:hypothetical protein
MAPLLQHQDLGSSCADSNAAASSAAKVSRSGVPELAPPFAAIFATRSGQLATKVGVGQAAVLRRFGFDGDGDDGGDRVVASPGDRRELIVDWKTGYSKVRRVR